MIKKIIYRSILMLSIAFIFQGCIPKLAKKTVNTEVPGQYYADQDTNNIAKMNWREYFNDSTLAALIDTALVNNQELNIALQRIDKAKFIIGARKGEYLPSGDLFANGGVEKVSSHTSQGASDESTGVPEYLPDMNLGISFSWEIDIWGKLRNAKKAAVFKYLSSIEGRNFMVTTLIAEIANSYYELMALDNQLEIIEENLALQTNALKIVKLQKEAAKVTELAVTKFKAEVYKNRSLVFVIKQKIVETENRINFLVGRFPERINRRSDSYNDLRLDSMIESGIPPQLLENRPDIRKMELALVAAKLDLKVAKAKFYPSFKLTANVGYRSFDVKKLFQPLRSLFFSLIGDLVAPLINRKAIKAEYFTANAEQVETIYEYEKTILNAYLEVTNELSNIKNLRYNYELKEKQVEALTESIAISTKLFKSARADYMEVLLTQRDALEAKIELVETKKEQLKAKVNVYQALGGGWR